MEGWDQAAEFSCNWSLNCGITWLKAKRAFHLNDDCYCTQVVCKRQVFVQCQVQILGRSASMQDATLQKEKEKQRKRVHNYPISERSEL